MRDTTVGQVWYCRLNLEKCGKGVCFGNYLKWHLEVGTC